MTNSNHNDSLSQIDLLRSLAIEDTTEDKVDTLWRQLMIYKSFNGGDVSDAKARRAQAESTREQAEMEVVKTTHEMCDRMRAEAEGVLAAASRIKSEAEGALQAAREEHSAASKVKTEAEQQSQRMVDEAESRAQEILDHAKSAAQQETTELRHQALKEIRTVLARVEDMSAATGEELETQRILTNVAKLRTSAVQSASKSGRPAASPGSDTIPTIDDLIEQFNDSTASSEVEPEPVMVTAGSDEAEFAPVESKAPRGSNDSKSSSKKAQAKS